MSDTWRLLTRSEGSERPLHRLHVEESAPAARAAVGACPQIRAVRSGHQHVVVGLAPVDDEVAAGELDRRPCGRSARAASRRPAAAQAPVPQARVTPTPRSQTRKRMRSRRLDLGEADVGALGEQRMVLDHRPDLAHRSWPRHRRRRRSQCGLPMLTTDGRMQHRIVDRADLQLDAAGVRNGSASGISSPVEAGRAHVDGHRAVRHRPARRASRSPSRCSPEAFRARPRISSQPRSARRCRRRRPRRHRRSRCA